MSLTLPEPRVILTLVMKPMPLSLVRHFVLTMSLTPPRIPHHGLWCAAVSRYRARRKQMKNSKRDSSAADLDGAISFKNEITA